MCWLDSRATWSTHSQCHFHPQQDSNTQMSARQPSRAGRERKDSAAEHKFCHCQIKSQVQNQCSLQRNHVWISWYCYDSNCLSPSFESVTKLQFTIEAMLRAAANLITDKRRIQFQIIISWNAKLSGLYITLFDDISCTAATVVLTLRWHVLAIRCCKLVALMHPRDHGQQWPQCASY